ncbi:hypothetical protein A2U01_0065539, partial [Trifolium medium]|nr:hypothetical protein [Trifolium medium]
MNFGGVGGARVAQLAKARAL